MFNLALTSLYSATHGARLNNVASKPRYFVASPNAVALRARNRASESTLTRELHDDARTRAL